MAEDVPPRQVHQSPTGTRRLSEGIQVNKSHDGLSSDVKEASS
jgi:hypothetical protein